MAKKLLETFRLFSEQLSVQSHYDFGLRAVKAVLSSTKKLRLSRLEGGEDDEIGQVFNSFSHFQDNLYIYTIPARNIRKCLIQYYFSSKFQAAIKRNRRYQCTKICICRHATLQRYNARFVS